MVIKNYKNLIVKRYIDMVKSWNDTKNRTIKLSNVAKYAYI